MGENSVDNWIVLAIGALLVAAQTISATVTLALRLPSRVRLEERFTASNRPAEHLTKILELHHPFALTMATIRTACSLGIVLCALELFHRAHFQGLWLDVWAFVTAFIVVEIFGVAIPRALSRYRGEEALDYFFPVIRVAYFCFRPGIAILEFFDDIVRRLAGAPRVDPLTQADDMEREILNVVNEGERHGAVDEEEKEMIQSVIELRDTDVEEIMTPRTDIIALEKSATLNDVKAVIKDAGHSRIPVYEESIDCVLGVLYAKDLIQFEGENGKFDLATHMRDALFVPESKQIRDLLRDFREKKVHIAVVLDEYGGTAGLVTIEDILEELVGEIADEYEADEPETLHKINESTFEVDARMGVYEINDELEIELPEDDDYETIGGFVFSKLGRIPEVGEEFEQENVHFKVIEAEPRRIVRLRVHLEEASNNGSE